MSGKVRVDGKTARACDGCVRKCARWYCAADDAFLCQNCDASVHSANPLARKHQRVRLKVASNLKDEETEDVKNISVPSWHHGFKRKPRSPRKPAGPQKPSPGPIVPELGSEEMSQEENYEEEQLLYRVPIYDPFGAADLTVAPKDAACDAESREVKALLAGFGQDFDNMDGIILPSDVDLAEFAADVESLLGGGGEQDYGGKLVKIEDGDAYVECQGGGSDDVAGEGFEVGFGDYDDCPMMTCWEETKSVSVGVNMGDGKDCERGGEFEENKKKKILLNLDYESVVLAWPSQRSPWTTGLRPEFDASEECWPDCMGGCGTEMHHHHHRHVYGEIGGRVMSQQAMGGREARVTRYREKRRTRLFSKKIRYEVRKLNAEKRPRMKGRFVKRASLFGIGPATTDENL